MPDVPREMIEVRAYQIWEQEGRPHGRDLEHWIRAAEELAPAANGAGSEDAAPKAKAAAKPRAARNAAAAAPAAETTAPVKPKRRTTKAK